VDVYSEGVNMNVIIFILALVFFLAGFLSQYFLNTITWVFVGILASLVCLGFLAIRLERKNKNKQ
jgi:hypothetical protein